jgi:hypothetical protein
MATIFANVGSTINSIINPQPSQSSTNTSLINAQKPGPETNADPNVAAQTTLDSGTDINNAASPIQTMDLFFSGLQDQINNSIMQRGNGWINFDSSRWASNYYYRFLILQVSDQQSSSTNQSTPLYTIAASYRFPINPDRVSVRTPYAINLTITSGGAYEEHNGTPIKHITISGTTGFMPNRTAYGQVSALPGGVIGQAASAIAPNSVRAVSQTIQSIGNIANSLNNLITGTGGAGASAPASLLTGYGQYQLLRLFLDGYATLKTMPNSQSYRLALHQPKEGITYLVTPGELQEDKSAASPLEYRYTIPMTAWGTANVQGLSYPSSTNVNSFNIAKGNILQTLQNIRTTVNQFNSIMPAVQSDYQQTIVGPLNLAIIAMKNLTGQSKTMLDYGGTNGALVNSTAPQMILAVSNNPSVTPQVQQAATTAQQAIQNELNNTSVVNNQVPLTGGTGVTSGSSVSVNVQQTVNVDPYTLSQIADSVSPASLSLNAAQMQYINGFEAQAASLTRQFYQTLLDNLLTLSDNLEVPNMDQDMYTIQYYINDARTGLCGLLSTLDVDTNQTLNSLQYWQVKSQTSGISFQTPNSKFSVPFPFNGTLEWLAQLYLGDPTRWGEIAALNNLQAPYVDEQGFTLPLLSNGNGNQFNVSDVSNMYDGQQVLLSSDTQAPAKFTVLSIQTVVADSNYLITVRGVNNLSVYTIEDDATMQAYMPYTINSQQRIYIPSPNPSTVPQDNTPSIPYLTDSPDLLNFSKIDWLLTSTGDLAASEDGFINLATGANNLVQAARLKFITSLTSLLLHPNYGNPVDVGDVTSTNIADVKAQLDNMFAKDPRFGSINTLNFDINAPVAQISMNVSTTFNGATLPLSFNLE